MLAQGMRWAEVAAATQAVPTCSRTTPVRATSGRPRAARRS